jgi:serine/threonine protein kinase
VTVVDWGTVPQPWVATESIEGRLADRGRLDVGWALQAARRLTGALAELHQQGIVHGGIDPYSVVLSSTFDGETVPMLDNVGLLGGEGRVFDPGEYLDPRYAGPEYFDDQYGRIDHATDVYQLGMVCYRLLAGRHPFDGSYDEVRAGVLGDRPPAPSRCVSALPSAVDNVIAKATAKQKLTRYETAHDLHRDVSRICDAVFE